MAKEVNEIVNKYANILDIDFINQIIEQSGKMEDFEMNKSTLLNIADWALNGNSDDEIRKKLDLRPAQWSILLSICPTLVLIMRDSRALADVIVAGSLFQTAIGGKKIKRQVAKSVTEYNEMGKPCGQHLEVVELEEELPPNADLLKFLATHKLSEKFGDENAIPREDYGDVLKHLSAEQIAMIELASKNSSGVLDEETKK